jgi:hypothetical protein
MSESESEDDWSTSSQYKEYWTRELAAALPPATPTTTSTSRPVEIEWSDMDSDNWD